MPCDPYRTRHSIPRLILICVILLSAKGAQGIFELIYGMIVFKGEDNKLTPKIKYNYI